MDNIVVIGGAGQLGQCLQRVALDQKITNIEFLDEVSGNILDPNIVNAVFRQLKPTYVINCAAYTAVDRAEDEYDAALAINATGVLNLAVACKEFAATLIHISTDFVFEGNAVCLLNEECTPKPLNVYGQTKLEGERLVVENLANYFIIRTSWLYSEFGSNFVKTIRKLGRERSAIDVVADQVGTPTYGVDLARTLLAIVASRSNDYGTYHYSNEGVASWYDFAVEICKISNLNTQVNPIPSVKFPTRATRPSFSVLDKSKIKDTFQLTIPYWRDSLKHCIQQIKE